MSILAPEWKNRKDNPLSYMKGKIADFWLRLTENFSQPKENSEEYTLLKKILWKNFERYKEYWTIRKVKTVQTMLDEQIIDLENILAGLESILRWQTMNIWNYENTETVKKVYEDTLKWQGMDKWDRQDIKAAKKLKEIGMEIRPTDWRYMKHRTTDKIKRLEKWKNKHWGELWYPHNQSYWRWLATRPLNPGDYHLFKVDIY